MNITRVVIINFRSFKLLDVRLSEVISCVIGENNTGKTNFIHAIRLCIDAGLSSAYRALFPNDFHSDVDMSSPAQVLIGLEIEGFDGDVNAEALVGAWQFKPGCARIIYRFRPKLSVRESLEAGEPLPAKLQINDYQWEIVGGGDPDVDIPDIEWNDNVGTAIRFADLQSFLVVYLPALRDVESNLRQYKSSPLTRLVDVMDIDPTEQETLLSALSDANEKIASATTTHEIAKAIDKSFKKIAGPAFSMDIAIGLAEPSFQAIVRALRILLTNIGMEDFDPALNGLGLNNILYISILIEYFYKRLAQQKTAGQIILFEEPEAHLHPQLQLSLFKALKVQNIQTILTTHSTHITSSADLRSYVILTQVGSPAVASAVPAIDGDLQENEVKDLERYLDSTKSNLLFARKVILVEGPAELFLIPALIKQVHGIDLDREGISVIPIYGIHFWVYARLFSKSCLPKKCAIITDGDLSPSDANPGLEGEDDLPTPMNLRSLENEYVKVFSCKTTFERAITNIDTIKMFALAAKEIGAPMVYGQLKSAHATLMKGNLEVAQQARILNEIRNKVLNTAKRFGKARFAQIATRHVGSVTSLPKYIDDALAWLRES